VPPLRFELEPDPALEALGDTAGARALVAELHATVRESRFLAGLSGSSRRSRAGDGLGAPPSGRRRRAARRLDGDSRR
jgi:hypothetical protein